MIIQSFNKYHHWNKEKLSHHYDPTISVSVQLHTYWIMMDNHSHHSSLGWWEIQIAPKPLSARAGEINILGASWDSCAKHV